MGMEGGRGISVADKDEVEVGMGNMEVGLTRTRLRWVTWAGPDNLAT